VLMLWPAPVPVRHRHGDTSSPSSSAQIVRHLDHHHGGLTNAWDWPDDWHWHWVFPGNDYVGLGFEQAIDINEQMLPDQSAELPELVCSSLIQWLADSTRSMVKIPKCRQYAFQSVAQMHSRQSLPELLGIMRL